MSNENTIHRFSVSVAIKVTFVVSIVRVLRVAVGISAA